MGFRTPSVFALRFAVQVKATPARDAGAEIRLEHLQRVMSAAAIGGDAAIATGSSPSGSRLEFIAKAAAP